MSEIFLHEPGDEALRPTQNPWKCRRCGIELYTGPVIEGHKARCGKCKMCGNKIPQGDDVCNFCQKKAEREKPWKYGAEP